MGIDFRTATYVPPRVRRPLPSTMQPLGKDLGGTFVKHTSSHTESASEPAQASGSSSIPHNPTCITCGISLATWEIKLNGNGKPLTRQKCFDCRTTHMPKKAT